MPMIEVRGLAKWFGRVPAVREVTLGVPRGQVVGLLGTNGAGKTTTIRMISGFLPPDAGWARIEGFDTMANSRSARRCLGYLAESAPLYTEMTAQDYLRYRATLHGLRGTARAAAVERVIDRCWLRQVRRQRIAHLSKGYRQRVGLAAALVHDPPALVLDEPTNGLDPQGIREVRELLRELNEAGTTLFLSSHLLAEVEQLCTRIGVLDRGRLALQEEMAVLRAPTGRIALRSPDVEAAVALLDGRVEARSGDRLLVRHADAATLNAQLVAAGLRIAEIGPERRTLEEIVLATMSAGTDRVDR
jgi:ABC-2 type transport system ATP-binding protein